MGETVVVRLAGDFAMASTFRLEPELERLTREAGAEELVMDMEGVEFMDSSALGPLLATQQRLSAEGVRFRVANPSAAVRRLLELTGAGDELSGRDRPPGA